MSHVCCWLHEKPSAFKVAEKSYKRDGRDPHRGLTQEQLTNLIDFDECVLSCAPPSFLVVT